MKTPPYFCGKFLLTLLIFFSLAGNLSLMFPSEIIPSEEHTGTCFVEPHQFNWFFDQIENYEVPESFEKTIFGYGKANSSEAFCGKKDYWSIPNSFFRRDLRAEITVQIFPSHFFL